MGNLVLPLLRVATTRFVVRRQLSATLAGVGWLPRSILAWPAATFERHEMLILLSALANARRFASRTTLVK